MSESPTKRARIEPSFDHLKSLDQEDRLLRFSVRSEKEDEIKQDLFTVCSKLFFHFQNTSYKPPQQVPSSFHVEMVTGGITNKLYKCKDSKVCEKAVLVRVYGEKTEKVINRTREKIVVNALSRLGAGPTIYGRFENGILEEFLPGRTLKPDDMVNPDISKLVAANTAKHHALEVPISKSCGLIPMFQDFCKQSLTLKFDNAEKSEKFKALDMKKMFEVSSKLVDILIKSRGASPQLHPPDGKAPYVRFIDFEYGTYGSREFDLANHFAECCGFECDWSMFPSEKFQKMFVKEYLSKGGQDSSDKAVESLHQSLQPWILLAHLFWGTWATLQGAYSNLDFDYLAYAAMRFKGYFEMEEKCLKGVKQKDS
eukprot:g31517.t1